MQSAYQNAQKLTAFFVNFAVRLSMILTAEKKSNNAFWQQVNFQYLQKANVKPTLGLYLPNGVLPSF